VTHIARGILSGAGLLAAAGCALNTRPTVAPALMAELWEEPRDLEQRDLFRGPGGAADTLRVNDDFKLKEFKESGTNVGYDVEDALGREWSVKLGVEARVEVAVSRLVWAIGYHQPVVYYTPAWTLVGDGDTRVERPARFRLEPKGTDKQGEWAWNKNPFVGTRQLAGLFVMMVMVNNWDLKTVQNPVFEVTNGDGTHMEYMVRDLGGSLGKTAWIRFATKGDLAGFEAEPFIEEIDNNRVRFYYQGGWREPQLINSIAPDDVRWVCELLARLSPAQLSDAFRAGGFTAAESERYVRRLREKIADGLRVVSN
jgi:hypothetical protein